MTQPGETEGYSASEHVIALAAHCAGIVFPNILVNNHAPSASILKKYDAERATLVNVDNDQLKELQLNVVERDLLAEDGVVRHDPDRLAHAVFEMGKL